MPVHSGLFFGKLTYPSSPYPRIAMKKYLPALLFLFSIGFASTAAAQSRPKIRTKHAFSHNSESGKGKTNKAQFRRENKGAGFIDLHPRSLEKFKTAKSNRNYKFSNGKGFKSAK